MAPRLPRARCLELLGLTPHSAMSIGKLKRIHGQMIVGGSLCQPSALAKLIERYAALPVPEGMDHARLAFRCHAGVADVHAWNVMIRCSVPKESILLYARRCGLRGGVGGGSALLPDDRTFTYVIGACARAAALREGLQVHAQLVKIRPPRSLHVTVLTTGVHFYGILGDLISARKLFDEMPLRNIATWNALMAAHCLSGMAMDAVVLFKEMLFEERFTRPSDRSMVVMLSACSQLGGVALARSVHAFICKSAPVEDDTFIGTALVGAYSKCGCVVSAQKTFEGIKEKNVLSWTAMTAGLAFHGRGEAAVKMLDAMLEAGVSPNSVTFTCLLSACCHAGLVNEGLQLFDIMRGRFGIKPSIQHCGCVVDLLGRVGMVNEARRFVKVMPITPDAVLWRTLLAACKKHGHVGLGQEAGDNLLLRENGTGDPAGGEVAACEDYVALSNMYASDGRWDEVLRIREAMKSAGVRDRSGSSSVQTNPSMDELQLLRFVG